MGCYKQRRRLTIMVLLYAAAVVTVTMGLGHVEELKAAETAKEAKEAAGTWTEWAKEKISQGLGFKASHYAKNTNDKIHKATSEGGEYSAEKAREAKEKAAETINAVKEKAYETAEKAGEAMQTAKKKAAEEAGEKAEAAKRKAEGAAEEGRRKVAAGGRGREIEL